MIISAILIGILGSMAGREGPWRMSAGAVADPTRVYHSLDLPGDVKCVALTFDDGPNPTFTPRILDLLDEYGAKATFFVSGEQVERFPDTFKEVVSKGHQIGLHCQTHRNFGNAPVGSFLEDLDKATAVLEGMGGVKPTVFRPTLGRYNDAMLDAVSARGMRVILWTHATNSEDSWLGPSPEYIIERVLKGARPGAIVLLHDHGGDRTNTVTALSGILPGLKGRGYRFITLDALFRVARECGDSTE